MEDINGWRNGLLLYKVLESCFDKLRMCLIPTASHGEDPPTIIAHILDPSLMDQELTDLRQFSSLQKVRTVTCKAVPEAVVSCLHACVFFNVS